MRDAIHMTIVAVFAACWLACVISWIGAAFYSLRASFNANPGSSHGWARHNPMNVLLYRERLTETGQRYRRQAIRFAFGLIVAWLAGVLTFLTAYLIGLIR